MTFKIERRTLSDASHKFDVKNNLSKSGNKIDIPMERWIKQILLVLDINYDTGGSAPVLNEDNPMSLLKNVAVTVNGKRVRDVDFAMLHYKNIYDYEGVVPSRFKSTTTTSQSSKVARAVAAFDFCTKPAFPHEHFNSLDALLPAQDLSSLAITIDTGAQTDLASNTTINTATLYPVLTEVTLDENAERELFGSKRERLKFIIESMRTKAFTQASNYQFEDDLPTGNILRRSLLKAVDNGARSDSIVSAFRTVVKNLGIEDQWDWTAAQIEDRLGLRIGKLVGGGEVEASTTAAIIETMKGIVMNDYSDLGMLNLVGQRAGVAKWQANVGSPTGTSQIQFLHEEITNSNAALGKLT